MTTTKTIAQYLGFTEEQYYNEYVSLYMRWLMNFSPGTDCGLQALMANRAINKWYNERHADLEQQALDILKVQDGRAPLKQKRQMYSVTMADIFANYPKVLFDAALKMKVTGNLN